MPLYPSMPESRRRLFLVFFTLFLVALAGFGVTDGTGVRYLNAIVEAAPPIVSSAVKFDFDGDGSADIGRWQVSSNQFRVRYADDGAFAEYSVGDYGAKLAPGDFNGGGTTDLAVFKDGTWTYKISPTATPQTISFGQAGDIPVAADYDNDGITDAAVFRPSNSTWYVRQSTTSNMVSMTWGQSSDIPVPGDYDDDGKSDYAVWRPSDGTWYIVGSTAGQFSNAWGVGATDIPVPADYDGDGQTDLGIFRRTTGVWYIKTSLSGYASWVTQSWGNYGDQPVPADYDGDGKDDYAIWRPTTGTWWLIYSHNQSMDAFVLGEANDRAVPSAYLKQVGGSVLPDELNASRLSPRNATGGTNLYSQNFSWGRSLVSLAGRAGHDLSLGIGYNSLVWTKSGSDLFFDVDRGNAGPGFRLGFPVIEPVYYDGAKQKFAYMMVTPSGARVEFRQTTVSNVYETADSSYTQLKTTNATNPNDPVEPITIIVTTTDGTQMTYDWDAAADRFVCEEIKDRNGNIISMTYRSSGDLDEITDTLGRVVKFNYDSENYPTSITQTWNDNNGVGPGTPTHPWASFSYTTKTIATSFDSGLYNLGPPNDMSVKVLEKVTYADNSFTKFYYNGYVQVYKVENHAPDSGTTAHVLNHVRTNIESPSTNQPDAPRFTRTWTHAQDFNSGTEVEVRNEMTTGQNYSLPGNSASGVTLVELWTVAHPDNLRTRIYFGSSGWKEGLPLATEDCLTTTSSSCTNQKRWTWTEYTQDDTGASYPVNPRVTEIRVGDGTNTKKTSVEYHMTGTPGVAQYGLMKKVEIGDLSLVRKRIEMDYNLSATFIDKRIIGLPSETRGWGKNDSTGNLEFVSKVAFSYDQGTFSGTQDLQNPTQHDETNYSDSYVSGRGNLTATTRCDVTISGDTANSTCGGGISTIFTYNTAGAVVSRTTPWDGTNTRIVTIGYTDSWNDNPNPNRTTYAYPTTVTDPANNSSTVKYRFDIGAKVWAKSPNLNATTPGKETTREYDDKGRILKETIVNHGGAYTRYEYPTNGIQSKLYSTIIDTNNNSMGDTADEVLTESWTDGAGRVLKSRTPHTFNTDGTTATWAGILTEYNILGQVTKQSTPTEINSAWTPTGDDLTRGWLWTHQKYDWKGRVVRKISTDGIDSPTLNDSDVLISYEGCGCAGGQITTIQSENVPRDDQPTLKARRTQKLYEDILGRTWKTVVLKWDGTPYMTTEQFFNGRDQVVSTKQTDNSDTDPPQTFQETTAEFDGHGRVWKDHTPEQQDSSGNPTFTITVYNPDDSVSSITDGRGTIASYTYNNLGRRTRVDYSVPQGSDIPVTPSDIYLYDSVGNRTQMTDATGTTTYAYDELSRITSETKQFSDLTETFTISYAYSLSSAVRQITLPDSTSVTYVQDKIGRTAAVNGQGFMAGSTPVSNIVSEIKYRAWGATKSVNYGSAAALMTMTYDSLLKVNSYKIPNYLELEYQYNSDGRVKFIDTLNLNTSQTNTFDRSYSYDHKGRLKEAKTGDQANGGTAMTGPYNETFQFDAFDNPTARTTIHWDDHTYGFQSSYTQNRRNGYEYDLDGNATVFEGITNTIDAAGLTTKITYPFQQEGEPPNTYYRTYSDKSNKYDGDGHLGVEVAKSDYYRYIGPYTTLINTNERKEYNVKSTVLGGLNVYTYRTIYFWQNGSADTWWTRIANLFMDGKLLAVYTIQSGTPPWPNFEWKHNDPTSSLIGTSGPGYKAVTAILDPTGANVGLENPYVDPDPPEPLPPFHGEYADPEETELVEVDGVLTPLAYFPGMASIASRCPKHGCGPIRTENGWEWWTAFADGYEGYMPMGAHYAGGGQWSWLTQRQRQERQQQERRTRPVLKQGHRKRTRQERAIQRDLEASGIFDNEGDEANLTRPMSRPTIRFLVGATKHFLDNNPDCEKLINELLSRMSSDQGIKLEGDIRHFLEEFASNGTLEAAITIPAGAVDTGGGGVLKPLYGQPGWGVYVGFSTYFYDITPQSGYLTFLGELIHAIGHRSPSALAGFTDANAVKAFAAMGVSMTVDEYSALPFNKDKLEKDAQGNTFLPYAASRLFHGVLREKCAPSKMTRPFPGAK